MDSEGTYKWQGRHKSKLKPSNYQTMSDVPDGWVVRERYSVFHDTISSSESMIMVVGVCSRSHGGRKYYFNTSTGLFSNLSGGSTSILQASRPGNAQRRIKFALHTF
jgi:hypothetical protein